MRKTNKKYLLSAAALLCVGFTTIGGATIRASAAASNDKSVFYVKDGASVKLMENENDSGIRFNFMIEEEYFKTIDFTTSKINAKIIPTALLNGTVTSDALIASEDAQASEIGSDKWNLYEVEVEEGVYETYVDDNGDKWMTSYAYLYGLPEEAYGLEISAVGYITTNDAVVYQTDVATRTMSYVASAALYDEKETWTTAEQSILGAYLDGYDYELALPADSGDLFKAVKAEDETSVSSTVTLQATTKAPVPVTYTSSDEAVATVDENGKVTAVGAGEATITATTAKIKTGENEPEQETATYKLTVYNYNSVSTAEEFVAMNAETAYDYYALTEDIDFTNKPISTAEGATYAPVGAFYGVFDGKGHALKNITVTGANAISACVFSEVRGTVKNVFAEMQMDPTIVNVKDSAFIKNLYSGGDGVENCYVKFTSGITQYKNGNGRAIAAIASTVNAQDDEAIIKNCVGVMDLSGGVTHPASPFGGAASIVGGVAWNNSTVSIENCYGAVLVKAGDAVHTPKLNSQDTSGYTVTEGFEGVTPVYNEETSAAYATVAEIYAAAKTGMTKTNGWNEYWTVDVENGWLKFNEQEIYVVTPELSETGVQLFAVKDTNLNKVAESVQLSVADAIGTVSYVSSNEEVATVDKNGKVTAVGAGTATVTASCGGYEMTCEVSVKNYYEISSAADFAATLMTTESNSKLTADYYYALTSDIDFAGIIVNHTEGYRTVGWDGTTTGIPSDAGYVSFAATFDGNGYTLKNLTLAPNTGNNATGIGAASLFGIVKGTIKNVAAIASLNIGGVNAARGSAFISILTDGGMVSNCYIDLTSPLYSDNNQPVAPIASYVSSTNVATPVTVENCVGVLQDIKTNRATGYASGLIGRVAGSGIVNVKNCYAVEIDPADTTTGTPEVYDSKGTSWGTPTVTNTNAYLTVAAMFDAAKTGLTKANGWNEYWTVDATAGTLKFGTTVIYQA